MRMRGAGRTSIAVALLAATAGVHAHHSHAMYDNTKNVIVKGTVKSFRFVNPHVYLFLYVRKADGIVTTYSVEASYTQNMERDGIGPTTFKPGDRVTIVVHPLRSGAAGGSYEGAIDARGHKHGRYYKNQR